MTWHIRNLIQNIFCRVAAIRSLTRAVGQCRFSAQGGDSDQASILNTVNILAFQNHSMHGASRLTRLPHCGIQKWDAAGRHFDSGITCGIGEER
jgi:hypothetical protein